MAAVLAAVLASACYTGAGNERAGAEDGETDGEEDAICAESEPNVGETPLRRLTRDQYNRTVTALLGLQGDHAATFPPDEKVGAFYSNAIAPVSDLNVEGYMDAAEALAEAVDIAALRPCGPPEDESSCAEQFIREFGRHAFRRPLTDEEVPSYAAVYDLGRSQEDFDFGLRLVVQAMLQSPNFLYIVELGTPDPESANVAPLTDYELASRLSYFAWNSMPDDELLDLAEAGMLGDPAVRVAQFDRMLDDGRGQAAISNFHLQWLAVDDMATVEKDPSLFPEFDDELRAAMLAETGAFANHVLRTGDGRLETLLTASTTVISEPLLDLYGIVPPSGWDPSQPIELDPTQRAGILTHASVLATYAHADQGSPVHRGVVVRENILCQPLPPPPPNVDNVPPETDPDATTRERFEQHTSDPSCAGCHSLIDGIGLSFEHYDAIGTWRDQENGIPIDARGNLAGTADIDGEFDGAVELAQLLASSEDVRNCVSIQWFRFAFGRTETQDDSCSLDRSRQRFAESDWNIRELLRALVETDAFRYRRAAPSEQSRQRGAPR